MISNRSPRFAIVDPALGFSKGHHLAAVEHILDVLGGALTFVAGGCAPDERLHDLLSKHDVTHAQVFSRPFYLISGNSSWYSTQRYIHRLKKEFLNAIRLSEASVFLYHTLSWEHARALVLALRRLRRHPAGNDVLHIAFAAFNPGVDHEGNVIDGKTFRLFRNAFRPLAIAPEVKLFTSCYEYASKYQQVLGLRERPMIHPVFFDSDAGVSHVGGSEILYFGDAKREKGFHRLPSLLRSRLKTAPEKRLLVHYTEVLDPGLREVETMVIDLAGKHEQVELIRGYLEPSKVDEIFSRADRMILDYDPEPYAQKTSGVLWLARRRHLEVDVPEGTWLQRENERLSLYNDKGYCDQEYREDIFEPFGGWLCRVINGEEQ